MKFKIAYVVLGVLSFISGVFMVADGAMIGLINLIYVPTLSVFGYFHVSDNTGRK